MSRTRSPGPRRLVGGEGDCDGARRALGTSSTWSGTGSRRGRSRWSSPAARFPCWLGPPTPSPGRETPVQKPDFALSANPDGPNMPAEREREEPGGARRVGHSHPREARSCRPCRTFTTASPGAAAASPSPPRDPGPGGRRRYRQRIPRAMRGPERVPSMIIPGCRPADGPG